MPENFIDSDQVNRMTEGASRLHELARNKIEYSSLIRPPIVVKSRAKSSSKVIEKIGRKRKAQADRGDEVTYSLESVTDILGFRFITLHNGDIPGLLSNVLKLFSPHESHFPDECRVREIIQYRVHTQKVPNAGAEGVRDPNEAALRRAIEQSGYDVPQLEPKDRDYYSSVHVVVDIPSDGSASLLIPTEFQLRSVFEDAYCEVDHKLFFEADRIGGFGVAERAAVSSELGVLRAMLDNAEALAALIKSREEARTGKKTVFIPNLDDFGWANDRISSLGIASLEAVLSTFLSQLKLKIEYDKNQSANAHNYLSLADQFEKNANQFDDILKSIEVPPEKVAILRSIAHIVYQEGALCRLLSGVADEVSRAKKFYDRLSTDKQFGAMKFDFTAYPTALFRSAQAGVWLMESVDNEQARRKLVQKADNQYVDVRKALENKERLAEISSSQVKYLRANIVRLQAFAFWRLSDIPRELEERSTTAQDRSDLLLAWKVIQPMAFENKKKVEASSFAKKDMEHALNMFNTALYIALDGICVSKDLGLEGDEFLDLGNFKDWVEYFSNCVLHYERRVLPDDSPARDVWQLLKMRCLHTLMKCHVFLGEGESAKRCATEIALTNSEGIAGNILSPYRARSMDRINKDAAKIARAT